MTVNLFDLTGRVALVTGSSRGIGRPSPAALADAGATWCSTASTRSGWRAPARNSRPSSARSGSAPIAFDVTDAAAAAPASPGSRREVGPLRILVNNAGVQHRVPHAGPRRRGLGARAAHQPDQRVPGRTRGRPAHDPARRGQDHQHRLRADRSRPPDHRAVHRVQGRHPQPDPGDDRRMGGARPADQRDRARLHPHRDDAEASSTTRPSTSWILGRTPAHRWGTVEDLVGPAVWLASDGSNFVNGQVVFIDGGMTVVV